MARPGRGGDLLCQAEAVGGARAGAWGQDQSWKQEEARIEDQERPHALARRWPGSEGLPCTPGQRPPRPDTPGVNTGQGQRGVSLLFG